MMRRGERQIGGKYYLLFAAMNHFGTEDDEDHLQREVAAARRHWRLVRVRRDRRRYRAFIYVFEEIP
jgi:hypothetical protein